ncbi:MAG TPA: hypothetical protein VKU01_01660 [Bryobacteraceae bacterium]|nr:hypothetical protein [Bryobacteraceae bacterium]
MPVRIIDETGYDTGSYATADSAADRLGAAELSATATADQFTAAKLSTTTNAAAGYTSSASDHRHKSVAATSIDAATTTAAAAAVFNGHTIEPTDRENGLPVDRAAASAARNAGPGSRRKGRRAHSDSRHKATRTGQANNG